jgi:hypothetical protein
MGCGLCKELLGAREMPVSSVGGLVFPCTGFNDMNHGVGTMWAKDAMFKLSEEPRPRDNLLRRKVPRDVEEGGWTDSQGREDWPIITTQS